MESFGDALWDFIEQWEGEETNAEIVAELRDAAGELEESNAANTG